MKARKDSREGPAMSDEQQARDADENSEGGSGVGSGASATDRDSRTHVHVHDARRPKGRRRTHFRWALTALPTQPETPESHQRALWVVVQGLIIRDGWRSVATAPVQYRWWYAEYVRLLAVTLIQDHVESCPSCTESAFDWLLSTSSHVPEGCVFSLEGITR